MAHDIPSLEGALKVFIAERVSTLFTELNEGTRNKYFAVYGASLARQVHDRLDRGEPYPTDDELYEMRNLADKIAHQDRVITKEKG